MQLRLIICSLAALLGACTKDDGVDDSSSSDETVTGDAGTGEPTGAAGGTGETSGSTGPASSTGDTNEPTGSVGSSSGGAEQGTSETDESTGTAETGTAETGTADTGEAAVTFQAVYEQVIVTNGCNNGYCHGSGLGGLYMGDAASSYASLVGVAAAAPMCDQTALVVPGSLEQSILWYRVRPLAQDDGMPCAPKMPQAMMSVGLPEDQAQLVSDWISGGAVE